MAKSFDCAPHFVVQAVRKAGIVFPISKEEALSKASNVQVRVDFDKYDSLHSIIKAFGPEYYPNAEAFYCAYMAVQMKLAKLAFDY